MTVRVGCGGDSARDFARLDTDLLSSMTLINSETTHARSIAVVFSVISARFLARSGPFIRRTARGIERYATGGPRAVTIQTGRGNVAVFCFLSVNVWLRIQSRASSRQKATVEAPPSV